MDRGHGDVESVECGVRWESGLTEKALLKPPRIDCQGQERHLRHQRQAIAGSLRVAASGLAQNRLGHEDVEPKPSRLPPLL